MAAFLSTDELFCLIQSVSALICLWGLILTPKKKILDDLCCRPVRVAFRDYFRFSKHPCGLNVNFMLFPYLWEGELFSDSWVNCPERPFSTHPSGG